MKIRASLTGLTDHSARTQTLLKVGQNSFHNDELNKERKALIENNDGLGFPFVNIRIRSFITASKDCRQCLLLVKFPLQKTDIDKLNSTTATERTPLYPS